MSFHINGDEPDIIGRKCQGFYLIQQQEKEQITDPANTAFLKFNETWIKLCFDGGTIFWRSRKEPLQPVNDSLFNALVLVNLSELEGVVGYALDRILYDGDSDTVSAKLIFSGGCTICFKHYGYDDYTTINC